MPDTVAPDAALASLPVAVTGASGHLGANLVRLLVERGHRVRALVHRNRDALAGLPVEMVTADLLDQESLRRAFSGVSTVFHLAAKISAGWESAESLAEINVRGTANVVEACLAAHVRRLVHMSSIQTLAGRPGDTLDEHTPLVDASDRRRGPYDLAKAEAERTVLAAVARGLDAVILNPTAVLGPFDFQNSPMGDFLLALARGKIPALVASARHDFVDARDVAAATIAAATVGRPGERYVLSGARLSVVELAHRWAGITGRRAPRLAVPMALARLAAPFASPWARARGRRPLFTSESLRILRDSLPVDRSKAERELGFAPRPLDETLRDTWTWMNRGTLP